MRKYSIVMIAIFLWGLLFGCASNTDTVQIAATTLPVFEFTNILCEGTGISVTRLVAQNVSCLHDYTLQVKQMRIIEQADLVVISGAGLEDFMKDVLHTGKSVLDASVGIDTLCCQEEHEEHSHHHDVDSHIWLSPENAKKMSENILQGLIAAYPEHKDTFSKNHTTLQEKLDALIAYGDEQLADLSSRELITFHDGFSYMAESFDLTILHAIEEEAGSEASAEELINIINLVNRHNIQAIFTERNSSGAAAHIIAKETGASLYPLDMALSGDSYFTAMYDNIDTLKEALK